MVVTSVAAFSRHRWALGDWDVMFRAGGTHDFLALSCVGVGTLRRLKRLHAIRCLSRVRCPSTNVLLQN